MIESRSCVAMHELTGLAGILIGRTRRLIAVPCSPAGTSGPNVVRFHVRELAFDRVGMPFAAFVQERTRGRAEAVGSHLVLVSAEAAGGADQGVIGHGAIRGSDAREREHAVVTERAQLGEHRKHLAREWDAATLSLIFGSLFLEGFSERPPSVAGRKVTVRYGTGGEMADFRCSQVTLRSFGRP